MASEGPLYPSVGESVSSGDANEVAWVTPENIQDVDADEATITAATFDSPDPSFYLVGRGYGFAIPASSTIDGIVVEVNRRSIIANSGVDVELRLRDANGALIGDNKAATATIWPTAAATATYGGVTDTWNTGLSAANLLAMVNDADFGVAFQAKANIANADIGVAYIRITVHYTPPASTPHTHSQPDSVAGTDAQTKAIGSVKADTAAATDATSRAWVAQRTLTDTAAGTDAVATAAGKVTADTAAVTDSVQTLLGRSWTHTVDDGLAVTDATAKAISRAEADAIMVADAIGKASGLPLADTLAVADALAKRSGLTIGDALVGSDSITLPGGENLTHTVNDTIAATDAVARTWAAVVTLADSATVTGAVTLPEVVWSYGAAATWSYAPAVTWQYAGGTASTYVGGTVYGYTGGTTFTYGG